MSAEDQQADHAPAVWLVVHEARGEWSSVQSAHSTREGAEAAASALAALWSYVRVRPDIAHWRAGQRSLTVEEVDLLP